MTKLAVIVLLAVVAVASAVPIGFGRSVVSKNHHVSHHSQIISPHLGLGYGMLGLGYPGIVGHSISSHSSHHQSHVVPHLGLGGLGLKGLGLAGLYPGGIGIGHGLGLYG